MGVLCRYISRDVETELLPSVKITDEKISSVIPLVFADFLVVFDHIKTLPKYIHRGFKMIHGTTFLFLSRSLRNDAKYNEYKS